MNSSITAPAYRIEALEKPAGGTLGGSPGSGSPVIETMPPLRTRRRGRWRFLSLLLALAVPAGLMAGYLYKYADDQYVTEFRFSVRHQAPMRMDPAGTPSVSQAMSGGGGPLMAVMTDSQVVVQYLKSRQLIDDLAVSGIDLEAIYGRQDKDFLAHLTPHATAEERVDYWRRMVDPFFDLTTGIISVDVRAFRPADAQLVATRTLGLAERLVNDMSVRAHADMLSYSEKEVAESEAKLKAVQAAMASYRNQHAVLFPELQATASSEVGGHVQESLIEARSAYAAQLAQGVSKDSVQMTMLRNRITALSAQLRDVHGDMARSDSGGGAEASLASVMSGYSVLQVDQEIAAKVYERALMAMQDARNEASQQSIYLAAFVRPALPQESVYPVRWRVLAETAGLSFVGWCLLQLLYHGIRDHLD